MKNYMFLALSLGLIAQTVVHAADDPDVLLSTLKDELAATYNTAEVAVALDAVSSKDQLVSFLLTRLLPGYLEARNQAWKNYVTTGTQGSYGTYVRQALESAGIDIDGDGDYLAAEMILLSFGPQTEGRRDKVERLLQMLLQPLEEKSNKVSSALTRAVRAIGTTSTLVSLPIVMVAIEKACMLVDANFDFVAAGPTVLAGASIKGNGSHTVYLDTMIRLILDAGMHVARSDLPLTVDNVAWHVDTMTFEK